MVSAARWAAPIRRRHGVLGMPASSSALVLSASGAPAHVKRQRSGDNLLTRGWVMPSALGSWADGCLRRHLPRSG